MSSLRSFLLATLAILVLAHAAQAGILGHSGVVLHVDKYGHLSGHSTHYDYRFYPEKALLSPLSLIDHHNIIGHHDHDIDDEHHEAFRLIDDDDEYHGSQPFFYYVHHSDHHHSDHHHGYH